jgi:hypothetical protein
MSGAYDPRRPWRTRGGWHRTAPSGHQRTSVAAGWISFPVSSQRERAGAHGRFGVSRIGPGAATASLDVTESRGEPSEHCFDSSGRAAERLVEVTAEAFPVAQPVLARAFRNDLAGLNLTTVPEVLIESGNMRNATDAELFTSADFQRLEAQALDRAILQFLTGKP